MKITKQDSKLQNFLLNANINNSRTVHPQPSQIWSSVTPTGNKTIPQAKNFLNLQMWDSLTYGHQLNPHWKSPCIVAGQCHQANLENITNTCKQLNCKSRLLSTKSKNHFDHNWLFFWRNFLQRVLLLL